MTVPGLSFKTSTMYHEDYSTKVKDERNGIECDKAVVNKTHIGTDYSFKHEVVWKNATAFLILHILGIYGFLLLFTGTYKFYTIFWGIFLNYLNAIGVTVGAHRHFTHKSFKATSFLRAVMLIFQTLAGQNSLFVWARDHRMHHRYSDTDGDPHNAKRGFFFSHIGWLMTKKHPLVIQLGKKIDMSDLKADWMVMFQKKYYFYLYFLITVLIPVTVPVVCFGETWRNSFMYCYFFRNVFQLNATWLVNSAAHLYGLRPYNKDLQPVECWFVSFITLGEGWHNYHHSFPWDYKAAEFAYLNHSASLIRFLEKTGLAWDLKTASPKLVSKRIVRAGDGTHFISDYIKKTSYGTAANEFLHPVNPSTIPVLKPKATPRFHEKTAMDNHKSKRISTSG